MLEREAGASAPVIVAVQAIDARFEPREWEFALRESKAIDAHWAELTARNPRLFNGRVLLQHRQAIVERESGPVFEGAWFETDFKAFIAWRDFGFPDSTVHNCFSMGALTPSDGGFLLGRMGAHTSNPGRIYFPAGTPDPSDVVDDRVELESSVMRELFEETGIERGDFTIEPGWTLVFDGPLIACMKKLRGRVGGDKLVAEVGARLALMEDRELDSVQIVRSAADLDSEHMPPFILAYLRAQLA